MYGQVRDELEHLLDDDMDMAEMYLTEKLMPVGETSSRMDFDNDASESGEERYSYLENINCLLWQRNIGIANSDLKCSFGNSACHKYLKFKIKKQ